MGHPVLHLPHLLCPHKPDLLPHLFHPHTRLRSPSGQLPPSCEWECFPFFDTCQAAGAFCFVTCLCGWYIFFAIMLASVDFPFDLPLVDLSTVVKGASEKRKIEHVE